MSAFGQERTLGRRFYHIFTASECSSINSLSAEFLQVAKYYYMIQYILKLNVLTRTALVATLYGAIYAGGFALLFY